MSGADDTPLLTRRDVAPMFALFVLGVATAAFSAWAAARRVGVSLASVALAYDGSLYLPIAKSFPAAFGPDALAYAGQAPGYPALVAAVHALLPVDWGIALLAVAWFCSAGAAVGFYALCRAAGAPALLGGLVFLLANPRWFPIAATAHPEPLALLCLNLCLVAFFRNRMACCGGLLALAALTRYPALLLSAPLAVAVLLTRRRVDVRALAWLGLPAMAIALIHVYLRARIPGFHSIWTAHGEFWDPNFTAPFLELIRQAPRLWSRSAVQAGMTYATLGLYASSVVVGIRCGSRRDAVLPLWVATIVVFQASLSGFEGVHGFMRFALLAWPAALLTLWNAFGSRLPGHIVWIACAASGIFGMWFAHANITGAIAIRGGPPLIEQHLQDDLPRWRRAASSGG